MNHFIATVCIDTNERRTIWFVIIETKDGKTIDRRPFTSREDAEEYADRINQVVIPTTSKHSGVE
jgi:hypothetical protein